MEQEHRNLIASDALAGIKPIGEAEHSFYEALNEVRKTLANQLEQTVQDLEHKEDKNYQKHFTSVE